MSLELEEPAPLQEMQERKADTTEYPEDRCSPDMLGGLAKLANRFNAIRKQGRAALSVLLYGDDEATNEAVKA